MEFACDDQGADFLSTLLQQMKNNPYTLIYTLKISKPNKDIIKIISENLITSKIITVNDFNLISKSDMRSCRLEHNTENKSLNFFFDKKMITDIEAYLKNIKSSIGDVGFDCGDDGLNFWKYFSLSL